MTTPQKGRIFISYRRTDSAGYAGRIFDRLSAHFGVEAVFMDVDTIEAGLDFVEVLQNAVQSCDVLVALIGRRWLDVKDETGKRRLDNPEDFVRIEVAAALSRDIRVIPVLVDGAPMPRSTELPGNLMTLARRNALQVNHHSFNADAYRLISQLELALKAAEDSRILKARRFQEEQERKEKEAREADERKRVESREQEERARLAVAQQARKERENRECKEAAEKARKEKEERERKEPEIHHESPSPTGRGARGDALSLSKGEGKPAWLPYGIGGGVLIAILILFGIGNLIYKALTSASPTATERPQTEAPAINVSPVPVISAPIATAEPQATPTVTPEQLGVGSTLISEVDGMVMVYVPAGEFQMGSEDGANDEKPVHTVYLDAFWIDRTEVTNAMYTKCVEAGKCNSPSSTRSYTRDNYYGDSEFDDSPVIYVSWEDASAYCNWADSRLPTEAEWEKAARGTDGRVYPWGDTIDESYANYNQNVGDTTAVGSYEKGASFYGAYDMAGNVWEWVSSLNQSYPYNATDGREDLSANGSRVLRGGSWSNVAIGVRSSFRSGLDPSNSDFYLGFRCSRSQ